jgi:hypothetical protein
MKVAHPATVTIRAGPVGFLESWMTRSRGRGLGMAHCAREAPASSSARGVAAARDHRCVSDDGWLYWLADSVSAHHDADISGRYLRLGMDFLGLTTERWWCP